MNYSKQLLLLTLMVPTIIFGTKTNNTLMQRAKKALVLGLLASTVLDTQASSIYAPCNIIYDGFCRQPIYITDLNALANNCDTIPDEDMIRLLTKVAYNPAGGDAMGLAGTDYKLDFARGSIDSRTDEDDEIETPLHEFLTFDGRKLNILFNGSLKNFEDAKQILQKKKSKYKADNSCHTLNEFIQEQKELKRPDAYENGNFMFNYNYSLIASAYYQDCFNLDEETLVDYVKDFRSLAFHCPNVPKVDMIAQLNNVAYNEDGTFRTYTGEPLTIPDSLQIDQNSGSCSIVSESFRRQKKLARFNQQKIFREQSNQKITEAVQQIKVAPAETWASKLAGWLNKR